jgi:sarcosine oxidase subunit beta
MAKTADAVVVGGGVMGCSILYNLASLGVRRTVLVEQDVLGSGSTGRSQAILRMHYSNEVTTRMAWESLAVFKGFHQAVGSPSGYVQTGYALIAGEGDRAPMEENVAMQRGAGVRTSVVSREEMKELAPALLIRPEETCAYEPDSGYADPHLVTQGYARRARELGAIVEVETPAATIDVEGGRVNGVTTTAERISTPVAVVAAGPWAGRLLGRVGFDLPLATVRHQVIVLGTRNGEGQRRPVIGDLVHSLSARPEPGGLTLVGVGETEAADPDAFNQDVDMHVVEDVASKLTARMPDMWEAQLRGGWSGLFTTTPDWHPILDRVEGVEGLYCAVGFSGHGFKLAPMVGLAMAEMVAHGEASTIDVTELRMDRFKERRPLRSRYGMSVLA